MSVTGISDGTFVARPSYFGESSPSGARPDFFDRGGAAWLPIGCFLVQAGDRRILIDAGLGPEAKQLPDGMLLVGGQLLAGLYAFGLEPSDIDTVICTHLHSDHVGWLFDLDANPVFPAATVWVGRPDMEAVLDGELGSASHIRRGLDRMAGTPIIQAMTEPIEIAPGIVAYPSPGHTLGHMHIAVRSQGATLLLVGDAITCPIQLDEPAWHSYGDVDPALGFASRAQIWNAMRDGTTSAVGAHFPNLRAGRLTGGGTVWTLESPSPELQ